VAGAESPALQISTDEKRRVQGVAELFSEEDLARFLQIMLRTFGDVSYKQEQRFHLELGLLKLVHAQRLLPLEQLLSSVRLGEATSSSAPARGGSHASSAAASSASTSAKTAATRTPPPLASRPPGVPPIGGGAPFSGKASPFEADKARKGREELSSATEPTGAARKVNTSSSTTGVTPISQSPINASPMSVAPNHATPPMPAAKAQAGTVAFDNGSALAVAPQKAEHAGAPLNVDALREAVLNAMEKSGSQMLVHALEEAEWSAEGNQLTVKVAMSQSMVEISYTREQERAANQSATHAAGRTVKVRLVGGATVMATPKARTPRTGGEGNFKAKAADEPLVKQMQEKFGAEIRMIVDRSRE
jgi:DNA polymerase-3 subunit gamma/tau